MDLDFSEFHDLMHRPFTLTCWRLPGGPRTHISYWWQFKARHYLGRRFLCAIGRHNVQPYWESTSEWSGDDPPDGVTCIRFCSKM